jgi:hypothetical protein
MSARDDDDDDIETTFSSETSELDPTREISAVFDDLEQLLKNGDVVGVLSNHGVNASLALTALDGLRAYLVGNKAQAAEDLSLVAEEIKARLAATPPGGTNGTS